MKSVLAESNSTIITPGPQLADSGKAIETQNKITELSNDAHYGLTMVH
jgi:hypothetical protein